MKKLYTFAIAAAMLAAQIPGAAEASTLSYNLSLNPISGVEGGTGSFTIAVPAVGSSGVLAMGNGLTSLDIKIDNLDFTLNNSSSVSYFYQGANLILASLSFSGTIGADSLLSFSIFGLGGYLFADSASPGLNTAGSVSISPGVSATPLPTTLPLLATGLGALGLLGLWRKRKMVGSTLATSGFGA